MITWRYPYHRTLMGAEYGGDLFSPSTVYAEQRKTDNLINSLDRDIAESDKVSPAFLTEWEVFRDEWREFLDDNDDVISRALNKTYALTIEYYARAVKWRQRFEALGGISTTPPPPAPDATYGSGRFSWKSIAAITITAGLVVWLVRGNKANEQ